jgi:hypothetical protein
MSNEERIENPFGQAVCDFCLSPGPRWSYDPKDPSLGAEPILDGRAIYFPGTSAWAACTRCATIFDRGDLATLARVCAETAARRLVAVGIPPAPDLEADIKRLEKIHAELKAGLGPRRRASAVEQAVPAPGATLRPQQRHRPEAN